MSQVARNHYVRALHLGRARQVILLRFVACAVDDFAVGQASNRVITLAARSASTLSSLDLARRTWPRVGMPNRSVNQDGCKGASVTLDYTASGRLEG